MNSVIYVETKKFSIALLTIIKTVSEGNSAAVWRQLETLNDEQNGPLQWRMKKYDQQVNISHFTCMKEVLIRNFL